MTVKRIVSNIASGTIREVQRFYVELFDLHVVMDQGWIATLASGGNAPVQLSIAQEGGSGTEVPDLSIEVDDAEAIYQRAMGLGHAIEYGLVTEPWGVRRFYLRDPSGKLVNVMSHVE